MTGARRQLNARFHYVPEHIIELMDLSDITMFDEPYTCVLSTENSEYVAKAFKTKEQLEAYIVEHHKDVEQDGYSIDSIYKKGRKMKYDITINVVVS